MISLDAIIVYGISKYFSRPFLNVYHQLFIPNNPQKSPQIPKLKQKNLQNNLLVAFFGKI
jgi:hypothetical protein